MQLTRTIHKREAIPLRAIPFMTGWGRYRITLDPFSLAHTLLTGKVIAGFSAKHPLTAYRYHKTHPLEPMQPVEWLLFINNLQDLQEQCQEKEFLRYEEWCNRSIGELPGGVFLWKDDFELFWREDFLPRVSVQPPPYDPFCQSPPMGYAPFTTRPPVHEYECPLSPELTKLVFAGFPDSWLKPHKVVSMGSRGRPLNPIIETRNHQWIADAQRLRREKPKQTNKEIAKTIQQMKTMNPGGLSVKTILEVVSPHIARR